MFTLNCDLSRCIQGCQQSALAFVPAPRGCILTVQTADGRQICLFFAPIPLPQLPIRHCKLARFAANANAWLIMMDRGSCSRNTKRFGANTLHTHTRAHNRLFIELATGAAEQINDLTSQLAHSAREEMAPTGLLLPFFSVLPCTESAWRLSLI